MTTLRHDCQSAITYRRAYVIVGPLQQFGVHFCSLSTCTVYRWVQLTVEIKDRRQMTVGGLLLLTLSRLTVIYKATMPVNITFP